MRSLKEETYQQQARLADYCRNGIEPDLKDVKKENLHHYRRLVFNIASDIIETAYPITQSFLNKEVWEKLVYDYFAEHRCQTPQVWRMPLEFYEYCVEKDIQSQLGIPFLNDLLYFEWLELEVHTMDDIAYPTFTSEGDVLNDRLALNPEFKLVKLGWPVHTTKPEDLNGKQGDYFLLIYREKESGAVQFVDLSILYTYILENLANGALLKDILVEANTLFQINDISLLKEHAVAFIDDLRKREFILGYLN